MGVTAREGERGRKIVKDREKKKEGEKESKTGREREMRGRERDIKRG